MNYEEIIDKIEDILEEGKTSVLGGKVKVDVDAIRQCLDELSSSIPTEIIQARKIVAERRDILTRAQEAAGKIIEDSQVQAKRLIEANEITIASRVEGEKILAEAKKKADGIVSEATDRANTIVTDASNKSSEMIRETNEKNKENTDAAEKWAREMRLSASKFVTNIMSECEGFILSDIEHYRNSLNTVQTAKDRLDKALSKKFEDFE